MKRDDPSNRQLDLFVHKTKSLTNTADFFWKVNERSSLICMLVTQVVPGELQQSLWRTAKLYYDVFLEIIAIICRSVSLCYKKK